MGSKSLEEGYDVQLWILFFSSIAVLFSANIHWMENAHICARQIDLQV